jgi:hypothetical protein
MIILTTVAVMLGIAVFPCFVHHLISPKGHNILKTGSVLSLGEKVKRHLFRWVPYREIISINYILCFSVLKIKRKVIIVLM